MNNEWKRLENITDEVFYSYNELFDKVKNMTFDEAYKALNGFQLEADPYYDSVREKIAVFLKFEVKYRNIQTTIFRCGDNFCEVWESASYKFGESEIMFDIAAHHSIKPYSVILGDRNVIVLENMIKEGK